MSFIVVGEEVCFLVLCATYLWEKWLHAWKMKQNIESVRMDLQGGG